MLTNLTREKIRAMASEKTAFDNGEKYFKENRAENVKFNYNQVTGYTTVTSVINCLNGGVYDVTVLINPKKEISGYNCTCKTGGIWKELCGHVACVLFILLDKSDKEIIKTKNLNAAKQLLDLLSVSDLTDYGLTDELTSSLQGDITVNPIVNIDNHEISLSFKISDTTINSSYIIKDIEEFIQNVKTKGYKTYGKNFTFNHNILSFSFFSQKIVDFIVKQYDIFNNFISKLKDYNFKKNYNFFAHDKRLYLFEHGLDDFYDLFTGQSLPLIVNKTDTKKLYISADTPDIRFSLSYEEKRLSLTYLGLNFYCFNGSKGCYILLEDVFYKVSKEYKETVSKIASFFKNENINTIFFEGDDIVIIKNELMPKLIHLNLLDIQEIPYELKIPEMAAKLYFDYTKTNVSLKVLFSYEDYSVNPLCEDENLIYRDIYSERRIKLLIEMLGFYPEKDCYLLKNSDKIYYLYTSGISILKEAAEVYLTESFKKSSLRPLNITNLGIKIKGDLLEVSLEGDDYDIHELIEIAVNYNISKKYYRLRNGRFINIEENLIKPIADTLISMEVSDRDVKDNVIKLPKYKALYLDNILEKHFNKLADKNDTYLKLINDFKNYDDLNISVPQHLTSVLRKYQVTGIKWLKTLSYYGFGGILADDMGLGKTLQIISFLESEIDNLDIPSLIIVPNSLIYNWEKEINMFTRSLNAAIILGDVNKRLDILSQGNGVHVFITTYDLLKRDIKHYTPMKFKYIIADEAQYIKNPHTQNAKCLKSLNSEVRFALTGTPMENSLTELWSIFDFIMPHYLGSLSKFGDKYENPIIKNEDLTVSQRLKTKISPFILRRIKKDVLKELPEKIDTTLYAVMTKEQRKIYIAYLHEAKGEFQKAVYDKNFNRSKMKILACITRLRQVCCHPSLFLSEYTSGSGKLELAMDTIVSSVEAGHRILLFSQFTSMLEIIKRSLDKLGISYFYLDGKVNAKSRLEMSDKFNNGENDVFLISLKAGGTGLNLTGGDIVMHFDPWWNAAVMDQATDRTHRIGQKKAVQVFKLVAKDSIEEKIMELQNKKRSLFDSVITDDTSFITKMTQEEIESLFL